MENWIKSRVFTYIGCFVSLILTLSCYAANTKQVVLVTSEGDIRVELFVDKAPESVENFLRYVNEKYYDNTIIHRVISGFVIQGGGFDSNFIPKQTHNPIRNEANNKLSNEQYTLSMARTNDPHSATSQFFINLENNHFLDQSADQSGYAVFGKVIGGQEVVEKIGDVETGISHNMQDVPSKKIVIKRAYIEK